MVDVLRLASVVAFALSAVMAIVAINLYRKYEIAAIRKYFHVDRQCRKDFDFNNVVTSITEPGMEQQKRHCVEQLQLSGSEKRDSASSPAILVEGCRYPVRIPKLNSKLKSRLRTRVCNRAQKVTQPELTSMDFTLTHNEVVIGSSTEDA